MNKSNTLGVLKSKPSQNQLMKKKLDKKLKNPKGFFHKVEQSSFQLSNAT
jgi:hypothetical protein